jgi:hypothetical protein
MVRYQGIIPALKYIVATTKRYQNLRLNIVSLVNIYPRNADIIRVKVVPIIVLDIETNAACPSPGILNASI